MVKPAPKKSTLPSRAWAISSTCTLCGNCVQVCPTQSIFLDKNQYVIDSDTCDGNAICAKVCPVDAIYKLSWIVPGKR